MGLLRRIRGRKGEEPVPPQTGGAQTGGEEIQPQTGGEEVKPTPEPTTEGVKEEIEETPTKGKEEKVPTAEEVAEELGEKIEKGKIEEKEKGVTPEEIERYKAKMQAIVDKVKEFVKNEDEPVVFRDQSIRKQGYWKLNDLDEEIRKYLKDKEMKEMPEELSDEIEKQRKNLERISHDDIRPEMDRIWEFERKSEEGRQTYVEPIRNRYDIELKALEYLEIERKTKEKIKEAGFSKEEIEEVQKELDITKESISKQYADLRKEEREAVKEAQRKELAKLREEIKNLREETPEEKTEE